MRKNNLSHRNLQFKIGLVTMQILNAEQLVAMHPCN